MNGGLNLNFILFALIVFKSEQIIHLNHVVRIIMVWSE